MNDIAKLPKWARDRIELLAANVVSLEQAIRRLQKPGVDGSRLRLVEYGRNTTIPLVEESNVEWVLARKPGAPNDREGALRCRLSDDKRSLLINASEGMIVAMPSSSNTMRLSVASWAFPESEREPRGGAK